MRVLLPAPFSPTTAWTSPAMTSRSTVSRTGTPKKLLVMPRIWRRGTPGSAPADSRVAVGPVLALDSGLSIRLGQLNHALLYRRPIPLVNAPERRRRRGSQIAADCL